MKHAPPGMGFSEAGELVPAVDFDLGFDTTAEERAAAELREYRQEVVRNLLAWLAQGRNTPRQVGVKVLILAHVLRGGTRKELSARLRVSRQRTHQLLTGAKRELAFLRGFRGL